MDRIKSKSEIRQQVLKKIIFYFAGIIPVIGCSVWLFSSPNVLGAMPDNKKGSIEVIQPTTNDESLIVRARATPKKTVYLDLTEGGTVKELYVEQGAFVEKGQQLVSLENSSLELEVIAREAQVEEQLNNLRNTRIAMEQDALNIEREITDLEYELEVLTSQLKRARAMHQSGYLSEQELDELEAESSHLNRRLDIAYERKSTNQELRKTQLVQLEQSAKNLTRNLELARDNLNSLRVTASTSGYISSFDIKQGEYISRGERIGQIDDLNDVRLLAEINEYYLREIKKGLNATVDIDGAKHSAKLIKIQPQIEDGMFTAEFELKSDFDSQLRRGQSVNLTIRFGEQKEYLKVSERALRGVEGQYWVLVQGKDGQLEKREVNVKRLGDGYWEVLSGLRKSERVVLDKSDS